MGTGWLLTNDILATSAHLVYDRNTGEKARAFKVWMGYSGKHADRSKTDTVYRHGIAVTAPNEYAALRDGTRDVAFVKVNQAFPNVSHRFDYIGTPTTGNGNLWIVGYPGDKSSNGEKGALMYEHYEQTTWNLNNTEGNVLEYNHVTEGGKPHYFRFSHDSSNWTCFKANRDHPCYGTDRVNPSCLSAPTAVCMRNGLWALVSRSPGILIIPMIQAYSHLLKPQQDLETELITLVWKGISGIRDEWILDRHSICIKVKYQSAFLLFRTGHYIFFCIEYS